LEILLSADRPRHQGKPQTGTLQKQVLTLLTVRRKSMHRSGPSTDRPTSGADRPTVEKSRKT
jgi:hypothetical protein